MELEKSLNEISAEELEEKIYELNICLSNEYSKVAEAEQKINELKNELKNAEEENESSLQKIKEKYLEERATLEKSFKNIRHCEC